MTLNATHTTAKERGHVIDLTACGIEYKVKALNHQGYALVSKDTLEHAHTAESLPRLTFSARFPSLSKLSKLHAKNMARRRLVAPYSAREYLEVYTSTKAFCG